MNEKLQGGTRPPFTPGHSEKLAKVLDPIYHGLVFQNIKTYSLKSNHS